MKGSWRVWLYFSVTLLLVVAALGWLTLKALELDRAEALARRQAELEEDISWALWRMDVLLMPVLAREAARPHQAYEPFLEDSTGLPLDGPLTLSPLLTNRSQFVFVNFQVGPGNLWSSPQAPSGEARTRASNSGVSQREMAVCTETLSKLQHDVTYEALSSALPRDSLPQTEADIQASSSDPKYVSNPVVDMEQLELLQQSIQAPEANIGQQAGPFSQNSGDAQMQRAQMRVGNDFRNRNSALQNYAQQELVEQRQKQDTSSLTVREGVSQPMWIGSQLLLARRVELADRVVIQGCWLNWPRIRETLTQEVSDLLPQFDLEPVTDPQHAQFSRMLATLPVQLVVPAPDVPPVGFTPLRMAIVAAWSCLGLAVISAAVLLQGVLALSERRGAFVSAVTHELRTPLTTFRMYSEMLAQGMVPDETRRQQYLQTLRVEADRLSHLVENVLAYARIERGRQQHQREVISVAALLERMHDRLRDRAVQSGMELALAAECLPPSLTVRTDATAVEQILFNLVDNACKYARQAQDRRLHLEVESGRKQLHLRVRDHGPGITSRETRHLFQPFTKSATAAANSAPGVGLGLALCRRMARDLGGDLRLDTAYPDGASFELTLPCSDAKKQQ